MVDEGATAYRTELLRTDETRAVVAATGWLEDLAETTIHGAHATRVVGRWSGHPIDTYIARNVLRPIQEDVDEMAAHDEPWNVTPTDVAEEHLAYVATLRGTEWPGFVCGAPGIIPTIKVLAASIGHVELEVDADRPPAKALARLRRERRQDAEGRTAGRLAVMGASLKAVDEADLRIILETLFFGGDVRYRGIRSSITTSNRRGADGHLDIRTRKDGISVSEKGIILHDLPDTVRSAIAGKTLTGRPLSDLAAIRGFDQIRIRQINRMPNDARGLNVLVGDMDGAALGSVDIDEALEVGRTCLRD